MGFEKKEELIQCVWCKIPTPEGEFVGSLCKACAALPRGEGSTIRCSTCKESKGCEHFHRDKKRLSGRFPVCKDCRKAYHLKNKAVKIDSKATVVPLEATEGEISGTGRLDQQNDL